MSLDIFCNYFPSFISSSPSLTEWCHPISFPVEESSSEKFEVNENGDILMEGEGDTMKIDMELENYHHNDNVFTPNFNERPSSSSFSSTFSSWMETLFSSTRKSPSSSSFSLSISSLSSLPFPFSLLWILNLLFFPSIGIIIYVFNYHALQESEKENNKPSNTSASTRNINKENAHSNMNPMFPSMQLRGPDTSAYALPIPLNENNQQHHATQNHHHHPHAHNKRVSSSPSLSSSSSSPLSSSTPPSSLPSPSFPYPYPYSYPFPSLYPLPPPSTPKTKFLLTNESNQRTLFVLYSPPTVKEIILSYCQRYGYQHGEMMVVKVGAREYEGMSSEVINIYENGKGQNEMNNLAIPNDEFKEVDSQSGNSNSKSKSKSKGRNKDKSNNNNNDKMTSPSSSSSSSSSSPPSFIPFLSASISYNYPLLSSLLPSYFSRHLSLTTPHLLSTQSNILSLQDDWDRIANIEEVELESQLERLKIKIKGKEEDLVENKRVIDEIKIRVVKENEKKKELETKREMLDKTLIRDSMTFKNKIKLEKKVKELKITLTQQEKQRNQYKNTIEKKVKEKSEIVVNNEKYEEKMQQMVKDIKEILGDKGENLNLNILSVEDGMKLFDMKIDEMEKGLAGGKGNNNNKFSQIDILHAEEEELTKEITMWNELLSFKRKGKEKEKNDKGKEKQRWAGKDSENSSEGEGEVIYIEKSLFDKLLQDGNKDFNPEDMKEIMKQNENIQQTEGERNSHQENHSSDNPSQSVIINPNSAFSFLSSSISPSSSSPSSSSLSFSPSDISNPIPFSPPSSSSPLSHHLLYSTLKHFLFSSLISKTSQMKQISSSMEKEMKDFPRLQMVLKQLKGKEKMMDESGNAIVNGAVGKGNKFGSKGNKQKTHENDGSSSSAFAEIEKLNLSRPTIATIKSSKLTNKNNHKNSNNHLNPYSDSPSQHHQHSFTSNPNYSNANRSNNNNHSNNFGSVSIYDDLDVQNHQMNDNMNQWNGITSSITTPLPHPASLYSSSSSPSPTHSSHSSTHSSTQDSLTPSSFPQSSTSSLLPIPSFPHTSLSSSVDPSEWSDMNDLNDLIDDAWNGEEIGDDEDHLRHDHDSNHHGETQGSFSYGKYNLNSNHSVHSLNHNNITYHPNVNDNDNNSYGEDALPPIHIAMMNNNPQYYYSQINNNNNNNNNNNSAHHSSDSVSSVSSHNSSTNSTSASPTLSSLTSPSHFSSSSSRMIFPSSLQSSAKEFVPRHIVTNHHGNGNGNGIGTSFYSSPSLSQWSSLTSPSPSPSSYSSYDSTSGTSTSSSTTNSNHSISSTITDMNTPPSGPSSISSSLTNISAPSSSTSTHDTSPSAALPSYSLSYNHSSLSFPLQSLSSLSSSKTQLRIIDDRAGETGENDGIRMLEDSTSYPFKSFNSSFMGNGELVYNSLAQNNNNYTHTTINGVVSDALLNGNGNGDHNETGIKSNGVISPLGLGMSNFSFHNPNDHHRDNNPYHQQHLHENENENIHHIDSVSSLLSSSFSDSPSMPKGLGNLPLEK